MNKREELADELEQLQIDYRHVYDGGYAEVRAIREWASRLDTGSREILWDILFEFVARQEPGKWAVALDTLVEEHPEKIAERFERLLSRGKLTQDGKRYVIFALLRLGYRPAAAKCLDYIKEALAAGREDVLSMLAASCRVDTEQCLALSSGFFGRALQSKESAERYEPIIPAFVGHFLDVDERLLGDLVKRTKAVNAGAAARLAGLIAEYVEKPFFVREVGVTKATALREQIHAAEA